MTASTLPLLAVDLFDDGHAWFPFRTGPGAPVSFASSPELGSPDWQWVEAVNEPHATMPLDALALARMVFLSPLDPDAVDAAMLPGLLAEQITKCHFSPSELLGTCACDFNEWPETAAAHMQRCIIAASRLLGVSL